MRARAFALGVYVLSVNACVKSSPWHETPDRARAALMKDAKARDFSRVFFALDEKSRWSVETLHRLYREARSLVLATYEEPERTQLLARFFERPSAASFAAELAVKRKWLEKADFLDNVGPLAFDCDGWQRCGYSGWRQDLVDLVDSTTHDLETMKGGTRK